MNTNGNNTIKIKLKDKIKYSIVFGLFISGVFLLILSVPSKSSHTESPDMFRVFIIDTLLILSYFLFPKVEYKKKERVVYTFIKHFIIAIICIATSYFSIFYYSKHLGGGKPGWELVAALCLAFSFSYLVYVFISIAKTIYFIVKKVKSYLFRDTVKDNYSATKKIIEGITALLVAATALFASASALFATIKPLLSFWLK